MLSKCGMSRRLCQSLAVRSLSSSSAAHSDRPRTVLARAASQEKKDKRWMSSAAPATKLSNSMSPAEIRHSLLTPTFPVEKMTELLDHDNHQMRKEFRKFISEPVMVPRYNISLEEERELALRRLQRICDNNFISVLDFWNNPLRVFAAHELAAIIDPAMTTKMTVQFNLFGGTVLRLGTERHHYLLEGIDRMTDVGCFGLTELGYGNNAVEMETTATYDKVWPLTRFLFCFLFVKN